MVERVNNSGNREALAAIREFRYLMRLRCTAREMRKFIDAESLAPGVDFGGYYDRMMGSQPGCSKSDMVESLVAGQHFVDNAAERLIRRFGLRD